MLVLLLFCGLSLWPAHGQDVLSFAQLTSRLDAMERQIEHQDRLLAENDKEVRVLSSTLQEQNDIMAQYSQRINKLENIIQFQNADVGNLTNFSSYVRNPSRRQNPEVVAFHATTSIEVTDTKAETQGEAVMFPRVTLNIGNAYHPTAGLFIAPTRGVYSFSSSILTGLSSSAGNTYITVSLMKNSDTVANAYSTHHTNGGSQGFVSAIMQLEVGDEVYVKLRDPDNAVFRADMLTGFSGFMLSAL